MSKILIIDDDMSFVSILQLYLQTGGNEVHSVTDGLSGLEIAADMKPDVILLDVNLPTVSGFDIAKRLRNDPELKQIPFIMISALKQEVNITRGLSLGTVTYLVKPFTQEHLLSVIQTTLNARQKA